MTFDVSGIGYLLQGLYMKLSQLETRQKKKQHFMVFQITDEERTGKTDTNRSSMIFCDVNIMWREFFLNFYDDQMTKKDPCSLKY